MRRRDRALHTEKMMMVRCWWPSSPTSDSIMLPMLEMNMSPTPATVLVAVLPLRMHITSFQPRITMAV